MWKKIIIILLFSGLIAEVSFAQTYPFTQYHAANILRSPSYAGFNEYIRLSMMSRISPDMPMGRMYAFSTDWYMKKLNSGVGFSIYRDEVAQGLLYRTNFSFSYSYKIRLSRKWFMRPGINYNFTTRTVNYFDMVFSDQLEQVFYTGGYIGTTSQYEIPPERVNGYGDFKASALFYNKRSHYGLVLNHLGQPNQSVLMEQSSIPLELMIFGDYDFWLNKEEYKDVTNFGISYFFRTQSKTQNLDLNLYYKLPMFSTGLGFRGISLSKTVANQRPIDAFTFFIGAYAKGITIGYSYDFAMNQRINYHEISVAFEFLMMLAEDEEEPVDL